MGKLYTHIDDRLRAWIEAQHMFFVATAPLSGDGRVNLSPKGYDSFRILGPNTVAYLDLGGSGIETQAHIQENGRITLMFCAFGGRAKILRLYGRGRTVGFEEPGFAHYRAQFDLQCRARAVIVVEIDRIADSCGWSVPFMEYQGERDQLLRSQSIYKTDAQWAEQRYGSNSESIDGLPGLQPPDRRAAE